MTSQSPHVQNAPSLCGASSLSCLNRESLRLGLYSSQKQLICRGRSLKTQGDEGTQVIETGW